MWLSIAVAISISTLAFFLLMLHENMNDSGPPPQLAHSTRATFRFSPPREQLEEVQESPRKQVSTATHGVKEASMPAIGVWGKAELNSSPPALVHIVSKAAIGEYLWQHILEGTCASHDRGLWKDGNVTVTGVGSSASRNIKLWFRSGWSVQTANLPALLPRYVVFVLNGHDPKLARRAEQWIGMIPRIPSIQGVGIVLHGAETCRNEWLRRYLRSPKHKVRFVFVTYATDLIDGTLVLQWPLGVATYRGFPTPLSQRVERTNWSKQNHRRYTHLCNFFGTIYPNSSREELLKLFKDHTDLTDVCVVRPRHQWVPKESRTTRQDYLFALKQSLYTLSPAGLNTECYRWLEAASYGNTPIIEDVRKPTECGDPLALLRSAKAPFLFVRNWTTDAVTLLRGLNRESDVDKEARRARTAAWYSKFRSILRDQFLAAVAERLVQPPPA